MDAELFKKSQEEKFATMALFYKSMSELVIFKGDILIHNSSGPNHDRRCRSYKDHDLSNSYVIHQWEGPRDCAYQPNVVVEHELTVKDLLVSFYTIKTGKHDLWYELFDSARCTIKNRSKNLVQNEKKAIEDSLINVELFERYLLNEIHEYAYPKREMLIKVDFDHGS